MTDLGTALIARTRTILKMKEAGLSLCWLGEYELEALDACCRRMNENNIREPDEKNKNIQRELILNDSFAGYYASLPHNPLFTGKVERLLEQCQRRNIDITRYKASDLVAALECEHVLRDLEEESLPVLAAMLDKKPLYNWRESDFGHITGLRADDVVQLLLHLDKLQRLVPAMRSQEDVSIALRSLDVADQFDSIGTLKESLLQTDEKWLMLAQKLELTPEFLTQYKESILSFLCRNGAAIAAAYMTNLGSTQREGFLRVVKAELMGKFHELKYHADDLQKELAAPLPNQVLDGWKQNLFMVKNHIAVEECDDFFSTMLAGVQPQRTCLSFKNGAYKECLLAGFDSNKKLLYAKSGDRVAGRAFLRLTKASLTRSGEASSSLTFIDVEHPDTVETQPSENIVLFLERPYVSGVDMETRKAMESMLVKAAIKKAEELGVMLVLSRDYWHVAADGFTQTRLYLYISRSKAGKQYLDSLNGEAGVSSEGSYRDNSFLVRQTAG